MIMMSDESVTCAYYYELNLETGLVLIASDMLYVEQTALVLKAECVYVVSNLCPVSFTSPSTLCLPSITLFIFFCQPHAVWKAALLKLVLSSPVKCCSYHCSGQTDDIHRSCI